jgi:hypothetical protein
MLPAVEAVEACPSASPPACGWPAPLAALSCSRPTYRALKPCHASISPAFIPQHAVSLATMDSPAPGPSPVQRGASHGRAPARALPRPSEFGARELGAVSDHPFCLWFTKKAATLAPSAWSALHRFCFVRRRRPLACSGGGGGHSFRMASRGTGRRGAPSPLFSSLPEQPAQHALQQCPAEPTVARAYLPTFDQTSEGHSVAGSCPPHPPLAATGTCCLGPRRPLFVYVAPHRLHQHLR